MMHFRLAKSGDLDSIRNLWLTAFPGDEFFLNYYLDHMSFENIVVCPDGERIISMLNLLPFELVVRDNTLLGAYVFSIATLPDYRNLGIGSSIIDFSHKLMIERNMSFSALIPAQESLFSFYDRLGYEPYFEISRKEIVLPQASSDCRKACYDDIEILSAIYESAMQGRAHFKRSNEFWKFLLDTEDCIVAASRINVESYCFFNAEKELFINELFGDSQKYKDALLSHFFGLFSHASVNMPVDEKNGAILGLIKPLQGQLIQSPLPPYMNMMFNT